MRKLGRSKSENVVTQSQRAPGLVGLLETMRVQMEVIKKQSFLMWIFRILLFVVILTYIRTTKVLITYYALHPINNSI